MSYWSVAFVNNFWLAILLSQGLPLTPPGLTFLNTMQRTADEDFAQTTFYFDLSKHNGLFAADLVFDRGGYQPSHEDDVFAPFYPDPSKRVVVVGFLSQSSLLVMKIETLLRISRERKGENIPWEEWQTHAIPISRGPNTSSFWVSGPRVFCMSMTRSEERLVEVYDLSPRGSAGCAETVGDGMAGRPEPSATHILPQGAALPIWYSCHDSIVFVLVKTLCSQTQMKLTEALYDRGLKTGQV